MFHRDKLVAALNKYWRPLSEDEYLHQMDIKMTEDAAEAAEFPKHVIERIWEEKKKPGAYFTKVQRRY